MPDLTVHRDIQEVYDQEVNEKVGVIPDGPYYDQPVCGAGWHAVKMARRDRG